MDKPRQPALVLVALLSAMATLPLQALRPYAELWAQVNPEIIVPTFTLQDSVAAGTTISIDGSPSMAIINQNLAQGFEQKYPGTQVTLAASGDDPALQALLSGTIDLAALGRSLTEDELAQNLTEVPLSREKIAIIVGRDNPFQGDLTFGDFARIFRGEITNWEQVGGPNVPIRFVDRPADSDTRRALSEYSVFEGQPFETGATAVQVNEDNTAAIVRELGNDGISYAVASEVLDQDAVRPVSMHNTLPDDPRYPYSQPQNYVYRGEPSIQVEAFLGFATNTDGTAAVEAARQTASANVTAGATRPPEGVALSPDGQFMVRGTETGQLQWLDAQGVTTTIIPDAHTGLVSAVVVSPDGQTVVSSGADGTIRRWDRNGNSLGEPIQGSDGPILSLALSPDGQTLISGNADGTVERWSVATGAALGAPILAHTGPVQAINYPAGGQNFITGSSDGSLAFWNADGSSAGQVPNAHQGGVTHITSSPDGQVFTTTGGDGTLRQWDRATLQPRGPAIQAHSSSVNAVTYSPNGGTIATTGADGTLQLWEPNGMPRLAQPIQLNAPASSLGFNPMGQLIVGTTDGRVELRDPQGELISATAPSTDLSPDLTALWQRMQNLPRNTWWLLAAVPVLLFLAGLIGTLLGIKRKPGDGTDIEIDPMPGSGLGIDFSGTGSGNIAPIEGSGLPPEAGLIPIEGTLDGTSASKLEQAKADLAEGRRLMREGRYDSALIYFNSAIEATEIERIKANSSGRPVGGINAIAAQAQAQRGHALAMLGQANDAMDSYNYALELDSSTLDAWVGKGRLLTTMGRYEEAIFCFDSALEINQSSAAAWSGKGQALMQMGRQAEGQACLSQAASLGGDESGSITSYPPGIPTYPQPDPNIQGNISPYPIPQPYPNGETGYPTPVPGAGSISPRPARPPEEQPGYGDPSLPSGYDPDIPLELQQMVMGLPSADANIAGMAPGSFDIPPNLKADIAHLPDQAEDALSTTGPNPSPGNGFTPTPRPIPPSTLEEDLINQVDLSAATDMDEMLQGLPVPGDGYGNPSDFMGMQPDPGLPPVPSYPTPVPTPGPPEVPVEPGDFIPPPPENQISTGSPSGLEGLPPEVLASLGSIPPSSPDSFGLATPTPSSPVPGQTVPSTSPSAASSSSWIRLSIDEASSRFYAVWQLDAAARTQAKQKGGETLAVRLYDVTGMATSDPLPAPVQEQRCRDEYAQDWYLSIPQWDRIYVSAVGYLNAAGGWFPIAQSSEVPAISRQG